MTILKQPMPIRGDPMSDKQHFELLAQYNRWMNDNLYRAVSALTPQDIAQTRGAFFGSILGTLNHILVADITWLSRIRSHHHSIAALQPLDSLPVPRALNQILFEDFGELGNARRTVDEVILQFIDEVPVGILEGALHYRNMRGDRMNKKLAAVLVHFFNHQTHHRGQVTALLSQAGVDYGVTDLIVMVPDCID